MLLPRLMTFWLDGIFRPRTQNDIHAAENRRKLHSLMSGCASYQLDDETTRLCQSVGPKVSENGWMIFERWKPPAPVMWIEFNIDVAFEEIRRNGKTVPDMIMPPEIQDRITKRTFGYLIDARYDDRARICQIGVACVRPDNTIETWVTSVDPQVDHWAFTYLHGINAATVQDAPRFHEVLSSLAGVLRGSVVYQHSGFDRSAIAAACRAAATSEPEWLWQDSVQVARRAWPELRGNGGHGLASLKDRLGISFEHHDAGEDARAAAEVVLHAEAGRWINVVALPSGGDAFYVIEETEIPLAFRPWPDQPDGSRFGT